MKTSELIGTALDWAVLKAEGKASPVNDGLPAQLWWEMFSDAYSPSADWSQGGPIIAREKLTISYEGNGVWYGGGYDGAKYRENYSGPTPLVASMRAYVASKLGDEVDVPGELK